MRVFFSYAREDGDFARRLASDLRSAGANLWIDQLDIRPGEHWDGAIEAALNECPAFLIVLSPRSVASQNVKDEVHFALEKGKKILPIMMEECELPFRLRRLQYMDFTTDYDAALSACIAHLKSLFPDLQPPTATTVSSSIAGEPKRKDDRDVVKRAHVRNVDRLDGRRILWVDDRPRNNRYERKTLEDLGASVHIAIDTREAMLVIAEISFDMIISDLGRPSGPHAGLELLKELRADGVKVPYMHLRRIKRAAPQGGCPGARGCWLYE